MSRSIPAAPAIPRPVASACVAVLVLLACGTSGEGRSAAGADSVLSQEAGSAIPCDIPLGWRLGKVDDGFDRPPSAVEAAVETAVERWERAAGRDLFRHDPSGGMPVHLVYGERQQALEAWLRSQRLQEGRSRRADARREWLEVRQEELAAAWEDYQRRQRAHSRRIVQHNERARELAAEGSATERELEALRRQRRAIETERRTLERRREELEERERRLQEAIERYNQRVEDFNRRGGASGDGSDPVVMDAGRYYEDVRVRGDRAESVANRRIEIYQFSGQEVLARVVAHELGHALGLGHAGDSTAVMAGRTVIVGAAEDAWSIRPADLELLQAACAEG